MENLQNYIHYTGNDNPASKIVNTGNVHETEVLTEEEIEEKEKIESGDIEEYIEDVGDEVIDVPTEESLTHIKKFGDFNI